MPTLPGCVVLLVGMVCSVAACGHPAGGGDDGAPPDGNAACTPRPAIGSGDAVGRADALIPRPRSLHLGRGQFALTSQSAIAVRVDAARAAAQVLADRLVRATGYPLPVVDAGSEACVADASLIVFDADPALAGEAYALRIDEHRATLTAGTSDGFARGVATLRQLFAADVEGPGGPPRARWLVPALEIDDAPAFRYRGAHLDVSRHFFSVAFVERYLDLLAAYKLNRFHFHLTDDQGWRIEIKKYPKLTQIGAVRHDSAGDYGGFYTQDDVRAIVAYAAARGITVVPEIELPGHASAALAAYPEYGCIPGPIAVQTTWGVFPNVFCPSEQTFGFLEDVLDEVLALFPSPVVHIGGDEVVTTQWEQSPVAQAVIAREHLGSAAALEGYFVRRIEAFLRSRGRTAIGWDEILDDAVPASADIMAWRGVDHGRAAAQQGHDVVMTPTDPLYFDHYQADPATEPPAIGGYTTVADVFGYQPRPPGLDAAADAHILGAQANLWTEYVATEAHAEYMLLPRALALAEVLWTDDPHRDYADFVTRLIAHAPHLDAAGIHYAKHALVPVTRTPHGGVHALPGTLQAEDYDDGGEGVGYHDTSPGNQGGQDRHDDVDVEATAGGGFDVGWADPGEWLEYTVTIATAGTYHVSVRAATPNGNASLRLAIDGADLGAAIAVPTTGDWTSFATHAGPDVTLPAGTHVVRVTFTDAGCNLDWIALTK
jgi:hexosaminidase